MVTHLTPYRLGSDIVNNKFVHPSSFMAERNASLRLASVWHSTPPPTRMRASLLGAARCRGSVTRSGALGWLPHTAARTITACVTPVAR